MNFKHYFIFLFLHDHRYNNFLCKIPMLYLIIDKESNRERTTEKLQGIVDQTILQEGGEGKPYSLWIRFWGISDMYERLEVDAK